VITTYERPFRPDDHDSVTINMLVLGRVMDGRVGFAYEEDNRKSGLLDRRKLQ
jgi:branched-chain amino acid transport system substrate-binding protein